MNKSSVKYPKVSLIVATLMPELGIGYKGQLPCMEFETRDEVFPQIDNYNDRPR